MKLRKSWFKYAGLTLSLIILIVVLPLSAPNLLFAHAVSFKNLSRHSSDEIPSEIARSLLREIDQRLQTSPLNSSEEAMQIYVADDSFLQRWLWLAVPAEAGGFILSPFTRNHAFFSGADFNSNQLISPSGYRPEPPRDLAYYGSHELSHVATANAVGALRFHSMPVWIKEGLADYVAMPRESSQSLYAKIGEADADLDMMRAFGVYAPYRLLVAHFLDDRGWPIEELLRSRLSLHEARDIAFDALSESR